jgi:carboxymethylenebutenolidase
VLHDRFGLSPHVRNVTNRLVHAGFYALAPDLYGSPSGGYSGVAPEFLRPTRSTSFDFSEEAAARDRAATLSDKRAAAIVEQAIAYIAGRSKARSGGVGVLGFSTGGRQAFLAACLFPGDVRAAVCFCPGGLTSAHPPVSGSAAPLDRAESLACPILVFYGQLDTSIRPEEREAVRRRLFALGKDFRIEVFPEAGHDFFCEERDTYRIRASRLAWDETLALLRGRLGARGAGSGELTV